MQITSEGQVTIPKEFMDLCGLHPHSEVEFQVEDGKLVLSPAASDKGARLVEHMKKFARTGGISADEIMELTRGE